ncbi:hypothetical protein FOH38_23285 [Lysinibacillus fusiformis]|nr:hypothetical protein FOH38_23285 [Lysinibacillus fusiformis]
MGKLNLKNLKANEDYEQSLKKEIQDLIEKKHLKETVLNPLLKQTEKEVFDTLEKYLIVNNFKVNQTADNAFEAVYLEQKVYVTFNDNIVHIHHNGKHVADVTITHSNNTVGNRVTSRTFRR